MYTCTLYNSYRPTVADGECMYRLILWPRVVNLPWKIVCCIRLHASWCSHRYHNFIQPDYQINAHSASLRSFLCYVRVLKVYVNCIDWNNSASVFGSHPPPQIKLGGPKQETVQELKSSTTQEHMNNMRIAWIAPPPTGSRDESRADLNLFSSIFKLFPSSHSLYSISNISPILFLVFSFPYSLSFVSFFLLHPYHASTLGI